MPYLPVAINNKPLVLAVLITAVMLFLLFMPLAAGNPDSVEATRPGPKVTICHIPGGAAFGYAIPKTIEIGERAVAAHLAHNDFLGACS